MRWPGFRRVRRQVCRRIERRLQELGLGDLAAYRAYLEAQPEEWRTLDGLCVVTISRFCRDREVFGFLEREVLPALALDTAGPLQAWSAGCASGEEPYTLSLLWQLGAGAAFPELSLRVLATDLDEALLRRARTACYGAGSLRDLPKAWRERAFRRRGELWCLRPELRRDVSLLRHDVRADPPQGPFDLVLCRNLAFTYFDLNLQREVCKRLVACLRPGGVLVVGVHESLPEGIAGLAPWPGGRGVYRRARP
jgi:chemotaxis protein methyltransferase CheR